ncbi:MAG: outer membrane beta-barrel protein [Prevotella sp.]|nr:outer membrane beta-barrel protein [Prevotella sp.]
MKQEEWTSKLRNQMADYEEAVPEGLWERIEQALPEEGLAGGASPVGEKAEAGGRERHARVVNLWKCAAAAAVVALMLSGGAYIYNKVSTSEQLISQNSTSKAGAGKHGGQAQNNSFGQSTTMPTHGGNSLLAMAAKKQMPDETAALPNKTVALTNETAALTNETSPETASEVASSDAASAAFGTEKNDIALEKNADVREKSVIAQENLNLEQEDLAIANEKSSVVQQKRAGRFPESRESHAANSVYGRQTSTALHKQSHSVHKENHSSRMAVALFAQNVGSGNGEQANPVMMSTQAKVAFMDAFSYDNAIHNSALRHAPVYLYDYEEKANHKQPVAFGLSLSCNITDRIALQTGVNYTKLSSQFTKKMGSNVLVTDQQLSYVGIPLRMSYLAWRIKSLSVYGVVGGEAAVNVKAKTHTEGVEHQLDKDRMQFSADMSAGVQYNFLPQLSLYAEPGLKYYFDNGSLIDNIYKDKPLQFSLQVGLRFHLK